SLTRLAQRENTYSAPLAIRQFTKETQILNGQAVRDFPRLKHAGLLLQNAADHNADVYSRALHGRDVALELSLSLAGLLTLLQARHGGGPARAWRAWWRSESGVPWRAMWLTLTVIVLLVCLALFVGADYHVLGTDRTGNDVLWQCLKSVRTALVIGTL